MSAIKKTTLFLTLLFLSMIAATQFLAFFFDYPDQFGEPFFNIEGISLYYPFSFIFWDIKYGETEPTVFITAWGIFLLLFLLSIALIFLREKKRRTSITYGSAEWATDSVLKEAGLFEQRGVILGMNSGGQYIRHDGPEHVKVIAPTRSGKGVGIVIPTLLSWEHSSIVYDLKSENWKVSSGYRATFSDVFYFNPVDPESCRFNPLLEVRKGVLEVRDVQNIADMIVDPDGHGMTDHWAKTGHSLLVGAILHVLYAERNKTLSGVADFLSNPDMSLAETLEFMMKASHFENGETHPVVAATARDMLNKSENERSGVLSTAMSFLSLYRDPIIAKNTEKSDFKIVDLVERERPVSLYIAVPPSDIDRLRRLIRLIINQICRRLTEELPGEGERHRLLMLLDEFPALGRLNFFESALGFLAGYGIKTMLISQSINQIENAYGARNSIIDNAHIRIVYTPNTVQTADLISRMLGQKTHIHRHETHSKNYMASIPKNTSYSNQETARALLTPDEVMKFPDTDSIIFVAGKAPVRAKKIRYFEDKKFLCRFLPPPKTIKDSTASVDSPWQIVVQEAERRAPERTIEQEVEYPSSLPLDGNSDYPKEIDPEVAI